MNENQMNSQKALSNTGENVIVGVVAVLLTVFLFVFVGWDGLKNWFSTPLIWHDPDGVTAEAQLKEETDDEIQLLIYVYSDFHEKITSYHMDIVCGSAVYTIRDNYGKNGEYVIAKRIYVEKDGDHADFYKALSGKNVEDIHLKVHVRSLFSGDEKLVKQTGLVKIIGLAVISVVSGLLVAKVNIQNQWLRLLLKLLCVPSLVLLFVLTVAVSSSGSSGSSTSTARSASDANARNRAAENYKRQAGLKAGAVMTGRPQDAARAQGQMDKSFADMIAANNSQAKKEYQKWAQHKANAEMRGNQHDAAFAQQQMDRHLAEMLKGR